eukprot:TRINITY_DN97006_c0_g1_i1.p1 TRINITY_DN97006_c0_g1~~TRINITY_DN97006_c0_g1_i1.p1  ORF type:complete len:165 (+),score=19.45 TRINITY_DN97006_c0_g1_i1:1963-2457(+)
MVWMCLPCICDCKMLRKERHVSWLLHEGKLLLTLPEQTVMVKLLLQEIDANLVACTRRSLLRILLHTACHFSRPFLSMYVSSHCRCEVVSSGDSVLVHLYLWLSLIETPRRFLARALKRSVLPHRRIILQEVATLELALQQIDVKLVTSCRWSHLGMLFLFNTA